jgi:GT2 family glycosyltransferase
MDRFISVIIPTFRRPEQLDACLKSLLAGETGALREVLLVVHEEDEPSLRLAARWAAREPLIRTALTGRASRSASRNAGASVATGEWFYFIDDDVVLLPDTLASLRTAIERHPEAAAVGGPNPAPLDSGLFELSADHALRSRLGAGTMAARYAGLAREEWADERSLIACNLALKRQAPGGEPLFDERLDYGEETHLLARMRLRGERLLHSPQVRVHHRRREGWGRYCAQAFRSGLNRGKQTVMLPASLSWEICGPSALLALCALGQPSLLVPYAVLCALEAGRAWLRLKRWAAAAWVALLIPSGHAAYGLGFLCGVFSCVPVRLPRAGALAEQALRFSEVPVLGALSRAVYKAALLALRAWASRLPVRQVRLHRGMAGADWVPGGSDIDLVVELPELDMRSEGELVERWHKGYGLLRRLFPMLGEVQMATSGELAFHRAHGPTRGDPAREAGPRSDIGSWTEQLHAYVRLARLFFDGTPDLGRGRYCARKLLLNVFRFGDDGVRACAAGTPLAEAMAALDAARRPADMGAAVCAAVRAAAARLESGARAVLDRLPRGEPVPAGPSAVKDPWESGAFERDCGRLSRELGPDLRWAIHDNLFHLLLGVSDAGPEFWMRLRGLRRCAGAIIPLGNSSLRLCLWSAYLEDPLKALSVRALLDGSRCSAARSGRSGLLRRHVLSAWKVEPGLVPPPPLTLARELALESAAHLMLDWRSLAGSGLQRWTYLYGRAMGLRLFLERSEAWSAFPMEPLAERFCEAYPEEARWVRERVLAGTVVGGAAAHHDFFSRQMRAMGRSVAFEPAWRR